MFYSDVTAYFIILATAVTLHVAGITDIETAAQAAERAAPAGRRLRVRAVRARHSRRRPDRRAGAGRLGRLRAVPRPWAGRRGWSARPRDARGFYGVIAVSVLVGAGHPVFADQPDEGAVLERGDQRRRRRAADGRDHPAGIEEKSVMGPFTSSWPVSALGWVTTVVMAVAAVVMFIPS